MSETLERWADACRAAHILAHSPHRIGGVLVKARPGPVLDAWMKLLTRNVPYALRRIPAGIGEDRLLGGLDLATTLAQGRPVARAGLLAEADGGIVVLPMAERVSRLVAASLATALDHGEIIAHRDGVSLRADARFGLIAIDESTEDEEGVPDILADRLGIHIDLTELSLRDVAGEIGAVDEAATMPELLTAQTEAMTATALALGIDSLRAPILALRVAQSMAALEQEKAVADDHLALATRLVLAPRATMIPAPEDVEDESKDDPPPPEPEETPEQPPETNKDAPALEDLLIEAANAVLPDDLLDRIAAAPTGGEGRVGEERISLRRGRPLPSRRGDPRTGARLDILATLRNAAPWQKLRPQVPGRPVQVRGQDFAIRRFRHNTESAMIFVVDASGSAAAQRLAEAKGAIELLLGEAYVRRDRIALVTMRGEGAELALPPTRALAAAKRRLSGLPGGGGTPMASGIDTGLATALDARRRGFAPTLILLTDGKANIARDGTPGREQAMADAMASANAVRVSGVNAILLDTSPRPSDKAEMLARAMGARYAPLPFADAARVSAAVRASA